MSMIGNYTYPARIWQDDTGIYQIRFEGLPEIKESASSLEEAKKRAKESLGAAVADRIQRGLELPDPSSTDE